MGSTFVVCICSLYDWRWLKGRRRLPTSFISAFTFYLWSLLEQETLCLDVFNDVTSSFNVTRHFEGTFAVLSEQRRRRAWISMRALCQHLSLYCFVYISTHFHWLKITHHFLNQSETKPCMQGQSWRPRTRFILWITFRLWLSLVHCVKFVCCVCSGRWVGGNGPLAWFTIEKKNRESRQEITDIKICFSLIT